MLLVNGYLTSGYASSMAVCAPRGGRWREIEGKSSIPIRKATTQPETHPWQRLPGVCNALASCILHLTSYILHPPAVLPAQVRQSTGCDDLKGRLYIMVITWTHPHVHTSFLFILLPLHSRFQKVTVASTPGLHLPAWQPPTGA